jgi:hypothetical protein
MWLKKFVPGLRVVDIIERPLKLYCDNEPAVLLLSPEIDLVNLG